MISFKIAINLRQFPHKSSNKVTLIKIVWDFSYSWLCRPGTAWFRQLAVSCSWVRSRSSGRSCFRLCTCLAESTGPRSTGWRERSECTSQTALVQNVSGWTRQSAAGSVGGGAGSAAIAISSGRRSCAPSTGKKKNPAALHLAQAVVGQGSSRWSCPARLSSWAVACELLRLRSAPTVRLECLSNLPWRSSLSSLRCLPALAHWSSAN